MGKSLKRKTVTEYQDTGPYSYTRLLGLETSGIEELIERVKSGFSYSMFETFQNSMGIPIDELARLVDIKIRTLARRRDVGKLESDESDRLLRASRILGRAIELFEGDIKSARDWFTRPVLALGNKTPLEVSSTEVGALEVENLIGRLEHGVFS